MIDFNQEIERITAVLDRMQSGVDDLKIELDIPASVQTKEDLATYRHRQGLARVQEMLRSTDWELEPEEEFPTYKTTIEYTSPFSLLENSLSIEEEVDEELAQLKSLLSK